MSKKLSLILLTLALLFTSCGTRSNNNTQTTTLSPTHDYGVLINGIRWATRNVDAPGTFAQNPEDAGILFQWNRRKGWNAVDRYVEGWDTSLPTGTKWYAENDPCPKGWRVPTREELRLLRNADSEWATKNAVNGRLAGTAPYQIFLPASGWRCGNDGALYAVGVLGIYWSSTQCGSAHAGHLWFGCDFVNVYDFWRQVGSSVRCVSIN